MSSNEQYVSQIWLITLENDFSAQTKKKLNLDPNLTGLSIVLRLRKISFVSSCQPKEINSKMVIPINQ